MTIANVSVPNIAGCLGISSSQGTWVITSYAVAEAIIVPLTGWIAGRFGSVRVFTTAMLLFGAFSAFCGIAQTLELLVFGRIMQGLSGGLLMPLSQTLAAAHLPEREGQRGHGALGDDDAHRAGARPDPRRMALRQLGLAGDLLHQRAAGAVLRTNRLEDAAPLRDPHRCAVRSI